MYCGLFSLFFATMLLRTSSFLQAHWRRGIFQFNGASMARMIASKKSASKVGEEPEDLRPITPRHENYPNWYNDVIAASDMIDQSPVRGCMVIKPWGMAVWDSLRAELDTRIKDTGAQNAYFPLFIPLSFLSKEAEHVDGFAKECAVVTHHRLTKSEDGKKLIPDPAAELDEPLVVRPTSETVIWHLFNRWIHSHRDLPLKINQWANVVRWEMRTRPFLRTSEFLWQEGHTAHATAECALKTAREMLDLYASVCEEVLAVPCVKGEKSPSERFAGAESTFTIEAMMQNGWALQAGTSHFLGQNFAKAFDVQFESGNSSSNSGCREHVWATSWGVSTRLLGAAVMTHSDDKGLVLPPRVAPVQVVLVPILKTGSDSEALMQRVRDVEAQLRRAGIRVKVDERSYKRPGSKYFEWERKGVPLRLEVGPRDVAAGTAVLAERLTGSKQTVACGGGREDAAFVQTIQAALGKMHSDLLRQARKRLETNTFLLRSYEDMKQALHKAGASEGSSSSSSQSGFYLVPWRCSAANEAAIKAECSATLRCYPLEYNKAPPKEGVRCFYSGEQATHYAIFARAF